MFNTADSVAAGLQDCVIANVFDQSPMGNHLGARHKMVNASQHKIKVGGTGAGGKGKVSVYGMWFDPGYGYHVDETKGIARPAPFSLLYDFVPGWTHSIRISRVETGPHFVPG